MKWVAQNTHEFVNSANLVTLGMFCRLATNAALRGIFLKQSAPFARAFSSAELKADECVLKKGEVYKFTDTGKSEIEN